MRIAQVAPLYESVPPTGYGGTERVVSHLTEELVRQGHQVTLFAAGDSETAAELVPAWPCSLRLDASCVDQLACHLVMLEEVFRRADQFDLIHFHVDYLHYPWSRRHPHPHLTTLHGRLDLPELPALYREYAEMPVASISDAQRRPLPHAHWQGTVYHGLPPDLHTFRDAENPKHQIPNPNSQPGGLGFGASDLGLPAKRDYLAFLGRISPEKRVDRAVEIARRTGMKLKVAAKVDKNDRDYFREKVEPLFRDPLVEYLGEVGGAAKDEFLGNAYALLFPIDWPEPFGLVMIEAMACGTPVIAWRCGSVPEVMADGVTGFVVDNTDEAVAAVGRVAGLDRRGCRAEFERRFTAERMARDYVALYRRVLNRWDDHSPRRRGGHGGKKTVLSSARARRPAVVNDLSGRELTHE
ncbi:MAG TPA: glycosyltransferase family 4 protein [Gemmataceae bacterium]|jgi:glycosyltransferase involved in cell wall biosynthesis